MSRKLSIFYSALMLTMVNLLLRLVGTSFQVYLSGRIGAEGIGLVQLVLSVGNMAMVAGMGGIRTATMYLSAEELGKGRRGQVRWVISACFLYSILFSGSISAALYAFAPGIARLWIGNEDVIPALRLYAAFLPCCCLCGVMTGYFTAANRIGTLAAIEIVEQLASMVLTLSLLHFHGGNDPVSACLCVIFGSSAGMLLTLTCLVYLRLREKPETGRRIPMGKRLVHTALPLALADNLRTGISTVENLMVPKRLALCSSVASPLGAFGIVSGMVFPVLMFPACILYGLGELLIPELARCAAAGSSGRIRYLVKRSLKTAQLYGTVFSGLMILLGSALCDALYSNAQAGQYLTLYAFLIPILYCDSVTDAMVKGLGQQKMSVMYNIITNTMDVVLLFILLPVHGMMGYFISFLITHLINFFLSLGRLLKITGVSLSPYKAAIPMVSCAAAVWGAWGFSSPVSRGICYILILGSLLWILGYIDKEDARWISGLIRNKK